MKYTAIAVLLILTACSKDDKSIRYEVDCSRCAIQYVKGDAWVEGYAIGTPILDTLFAEETPDPIDTGIVDVDTVGWVDASWRMEFDEEEDFSPGLKSRIIPGHHTTARVYVDGVLTKEGSSQTYGEEVSL